jgi:hypothetical protein
MPAAPPAHNPFLGNSGRGNLIGPTRGNILPFCSAGPGALGMGHGTTHSQTPSGQPLHNRPVAVRHQDLIQFALPQHPNTAEGQTAYRAQVVAWHTANPNRRPDEQHPYPLTPGSPVVGSRKCWDCGQKGHMQAAAICKGPVLSEPERDWCRIAGSIAHAYHSEHLTASHTANFVGTQQYVPYPQYNHQQSYAGGGYVDDADDSQGNGQGLSA